MSTVAAKSTRRRAPASTVRPPRRAHSPATGATDRREASAPAPVERSEQQLRGRVDLEAKLDAATDMLVKVAVFLDKLEEQSRDGLRALLRDLHPELVNLESRDGGDSEADQAALGAFKAEGDVAACLFEVASSAS